MEWCNVSTVCCNQQTQWWDSLSWLLCLRQHTVGAAYGSNYRIQYRHLHRRILFISVGYLTLEPTTLSKCLGAVIGGLQHTYINLLKVRESRAEVESVESYLGKIKTAPLIQIFSAQWEYLLGEEGRGAAALPPPQALPLEGDSAERSCRWLAPPSPGGPVQSFSSGLCGEIRGSCQVSSVTVRLASILFSN